MAEPRLSKIIIGILVVSIFSLGIMLFASTGANEYNAPGYTNSSLQEYYSIASEANDIAEDTANTLDNTSAGTGSEFDIFGGFFSRAWSSLKTTWSSITTLDKLTNQAVGDIPLVNNQFRNALQTFMFSVVLIIIVVGVFFHFIRSSNRL